MAKATKEYLLNNHGVWPNSFSALAPHAEEISDLEWAAARVRFDYDADTNKLAQQDPRDFDGIRYNPPSFVPNNETADLLAILRKYAYTEG
ncbi:hypothetical protein N9Y42_10655 [Mariniblastus sp.]|nr:hypothetical protein [Mariniblastus sp.]